MRVLVACEYSGIVRDAFLAEGHDAISCDLLPTESPGPHIQGDVRPLLKEPWDLVIAHPPCTYLTKLQELFKNWERQPHFWPNVHKAIEFFLACKNANAPRVCVENPVPSSWARAKIGSPSDYVEPFYFNEPYRKKTGLWLKGLPPLMRGCRITDPVSWIDMPTTEKYASEHRKWRSLQGGIARRSKLRARFWPGIARAMAQQWGHLDQPRAKMEATR